MVLIWFLVPYLIVVLLSVIISYYMYAKTIVVLRDELINQNLGILEQTKENVSQRFSELESFSLNIVSDPKVVAFQYVKEPMTNIQVNRLIELQQQLQNYTTSNQLIAGYYLFYNKSEYAISSDKAYEVKKMEQLIYKPGMTSQGWAEKIMSEYHAGNFQEEQVFVNNLNDTQAKVNYIPYVRSIGYPNYYNGSLVILLKSDEIKKLLSRVDLSAGGWAYIADKNNRIITSISSDGNEASTVNPYLEISSKCTFMDQINKQSMIVSYVTAENKEWKFVAVQPEHIVLEKANYVKKLSISVFALMLFIGLFVSILFANRNRRPVQALLQAVQHSFDQEHRKKNIFIIIQDAIQQMKDKNENLSKKIKEQIPLLQSSLFQRILHGHFISPKSMDLLLEHMGFETSTTDRFVVVLAKFPLYDKEWDENSLGVLDLRKALLRDLLEQTLVNKGFFTDTEEDQFALIFTFKSGDADSWKSKIKEYIEELSAQVYKAYTFRMKFSVGSICDHLEETSVSYRHAINGFMMMNNHDHATYWYDESFKQQDLYEYSLEDEQKLLNQLKTGNRAEVRRILEELYQNHFTNRYLSIAVTQLFVQELLGTLIKLCEQMNILHSELDIPQLIERMIQPNQYQGDLSSKFETLIEWYDMACIELMDRKQKKDEYLLENVKFFIDERYCEIDMSLSFVADHFQLSETFLSIHLKEFLGMTFSEYLIHQRMKEAKRLLHETLLSIEMVAAQVGYSSSNSFCRAFKRLNGVSPNQYRHSN